jgi:type IV pilus assembly protein PilC
MRKLGTVPNMVIQMIAVGEASGSLEAMLNFASDSLEQEISTRLSRTMSMLEPMLMLLMGAVIGAIVIMIYLPIFSIIEAVR